MTHNTWNPIGSTSPKDLSDNARSLDLLVLGDNPAYLDRNGVPRKSWKGMEQEHANDQARRYTEYAQDEAQRGAEFGAAQDARALQFNTFLDASGYEPPISYAPGILLDRTTQTVTYLGNVYRAKGSLIPFTTSNWVNDEAKLKLVGDDSLRQDMANTTDPTKGGVVLGRGVVAVESIAALLTQPRRVDLLFSVESYYAGDNLGGGQWKWRPSSNAAPTYGTVLAVPGVPNGRFVRVHVGNTFSADMFGVRASNSGTENRLRLSALFRCCFRLSATVHLPDYDYPLDWSQPVIAPSDTTIRGGRGWAELVNEAPLPPVNAANNPDGSRKCAGGVFVTGDPITGLRYMGRRNNIYMGKVVWIGVKIRNPNKLSTAADQSLHGIFANGGVNIYIDCEINDMPNNGYANTAAREVHCLRSKGRRNGLLAEGGAKNGISNTSTYTVTDFEYPIEDRSRMLTVVSCEFTHNKDEGVQYSSFPFVLFQGNDLKFNGDRAIEGDNAYSQTSKTRENDKVHVYNNDCRGVPGVTKHSMTFNDGFNKDVYLAGNIMGGCTGVVLSASCSSFGSFNFTGRNTFELDSAGLTSGCHAMYLNAGFIDLQAGGFVTGNHNRGPLEAALLSANNELGGGGTLLMGDFTSNVTFVRALYARTSTEVRLKNVRCPTSRGYALIALKGNASLIEISDADGVMNSSGYQADGFITLQGLDIFTLDKLILKNNLNDVNPVTCYPIATAGGTPTKWRINRLISSGNYWKGYSYGGGSERLTVVPALATKSSANDLPILR
ncbi:right-handed parallel beta-helix repeat-containing protein [Pseudomonas psychrophila]|uniref:right-handed parallel beta-helix repeat-containing protein n=1 Tax=Pseudomonas psychrophila TaxID=122355 RepID=UPI00381EEB4B